MPLAIVELLKLSLNVFFSLAKMNNATAEELDAIYAEEKDKFEVNTPDKLEDV